LIHQSMDQGRRTYHVSAHVFDMCEGMNPRQVLATLFHDVVYYQLDGGFPQQAHKLLMRSIRVEQHTLMIRAIAEDDKGLALCAGVFGFRPGEILPLFGGMNEFLSALVAIRLLEAHLPASELLAIAACIEATVPFRGAAANGSGPYERLADRLRGVNQALNFAVPEPDIERMVADAVVMANQDVASFAETDPGTFLSTTWLLIEESNAPLAAVGIYSIQDYRGALVRMEKFLSTLNADHVFHQYKTTPDAEKFSTLRNNARANLQFATHYLGAKIVSIAVVEALALMTGGNCPVSMFLGDIRSAYGKPDRAEDFLPAVPDVAAVDIQMVGVLERGRTKESANDLTASPLTAFIYRYLGQDGTKQALVSAKQMFAGELSALEFLGGLNRDMVRALIRACARIALSREAPLLALEQAL
ncbi:MAG: hypothetical protein ABL891_17865, partial [Burkholderiales bacterium]